MSDRRVTVCEAGRRAPALLLLFALFALVAGVCHGAHGHSLPLAGGPSGAGVTAATAPELPHGCERPGGGWSFDAHLPAQSTGTPLSAPDAAGAVLLAYDEVFPEAPHTRCVRGRAGPGPAPGGLLIALGVNRN
ncbi:hypothetical protein [Streptomyces sp. NPDC051909]|uniref:hypothetical protein n=1 Tax=Streptomyces sp. NPDC051909 TaxID=3154944 RepID=UPI00343F0C1D